MGSKIPYNKKLNGGKQWGTGGPRDLQRRQGLVYGNASYGNAVIQLPNMSVEELKQLLGGASPIDKNGSGQMSFKEVKRKIDEAVQFTIKQEKERYESALRNLNDQLDSVRKKAGAVEEQLIEKNVEIKKLKRQIINEPQNLDAELEKKNNEINNLKSKIEEKDKVIERLSDSYNKNIDILKNKIDEIDNKLSHGILSTGEHKSGLDRPKLEDDVFIDPLEKDELELDPHIKIEADGASSESTIRDIREDVDKLRRLLNKSKNSPTG